MSKEDNEQLYTSVMHDFNKMREEKPELLAKLISGMHEGLTVEGFEAWLNNKCGMTKENDHG
jgi:hypothetical protein